MVFTISYASRVSLKMDRSYLLPIGDVYTVGIFIQYHLHNAAAASPLCLACYQRQRCTGYQLAYRICNRPSEVDWVHAQCVCQLLDAPFYVEMRPRRVSAVALHAPTELPRDELSQ